jgi:UDP-GlcNAc:undecaprenyl-phosphate GlcNAc-1-phosphate transferase
MNLAISTLTQILELPSSQPLAFLIALVISFIITPKIKERAQLFTPRVAETGRALCENRNQVPRLGGVSIFIATIITTLAYIVIYGRYTPSGIEHLELEAILVGSTIIFVVGLCDDLRPINPWIKLLCQTIAAGSTWVLGLQMKYMVNPMYFLDSSLPDHLTLNSLESFLLTVIFLIAVSNAINLIDGIDGLAAGVAIICSISVWAVALSDLLYRPDAAVLSATIAGSALGFLRYNFNPARIFLGDNGAYLLGFVLACVSCLGLTKKVTVGILSPALLLFFAFPLIDVTWAILRRASRLRNPLKPDREHVHHLLLNLGLSHKQISFTMYFVSFIFGAWGCYSVDTATLKVYLGITISILIIWLIFSLIFNQAKQKYHKNTKK